MLDCYKNRYRLQTSNLTTAYHVRTIGTKNEAVGMNFSLDVLKMCILFLKSKQALHIQRVSHTSIRTVESTSCLSVGIEKRKQEHTHIVRYSVGKVGYGDNGIV